MRMQRRMAMKAPVLRPAVERKAWAWQRLCPLVPRRHTHTRRFRVVVLLSMGSPPSHTTTGRRYNSCSAFWNPRRRDMTLAVLSGRTDGWGERGSE